MAQKIQIKRSTTTTTPPAGTLSIGELAYTEVAGVKRLFIGEADNSTAFEVAGANYALLASPAFTGTPTAPTPSLGDNSTNIATTAYVLANSSTNTLASGDIFVGNSSNVATAVAMSGDATLDNTGALTIANGAVTGAKIASATITGVNIVNATITGAKVATNTIANSNLSQAGANTWKGNNTGAIANVTDNTTGALTEATSSVLTITGGTNALLNNASIQVKQATTTQSGYLSNTDWNTFNNKQNLIASPTANDFVYVNGSGAVVDSGISLSTVSTTNNNTTVLSSAAVQTAINNKIANALIIQGTWNASTNTPTLTAGTGTTGYAYYVSVAGTQTLPSGVSTSYNVGDLVFYANGIWDRLESTQAVNSVFGRTGAITATTGDYTIAQITNGLSNVLTSANIFVGNASNVATGVAVSGDATITNAGVLTVGAGAITASKIANNTITATQIANATITGTQIASNVALAGSPTTTTPTFGDSSTNIATTAFVTAVTIDGGTF